MRARNLKPAIFTNEQLAHLGSDSFRLFTGLWCLADRQGRLEDRPQKIEAMIFPFKFQTIKIDELLAGLASGDDPFIIRYQVNKAMFIQVKNFSAHQNPHHRESPSTIPPCKNKAQPRHGLGTTKTRPSRADSLFSDSPSLIPDSPLPPPGGFNALWSKYPNKDGRKAAERHFAASVKTMSDFQAIQKALDNYLTSERVRRGFIKNGSSWFNNWKDWVNFTEDLNHARKDTAGGAYIGAQTTPGKYAKISDKQPDAEVDPKS